MDPENILKYSQLDCGIHPGYTGEAALPFFDEINPGEIDLLLITYFYFTAWVDLKYSPFVAIFT